jgi:hypothetical protein
MKKPVNPGAAPAKTAAKPTRKAAGAGTASAPKTRKATAHAAPKAQALFVASPADIEAGERLIARHTRHSALRTPEVAVTSRPFFLRRGPMENLATAIIGMGFLMMFQPFVMQLYSWSFVTMLFGTVMFIIVSKFPE